MEHIYNFMVTCIYISKLAYKAVGINKIQVSVKYIIRKYLFDFNEKVKSKRQSNAC